MVKTLPGWRDFERAVALAFQGVAQESKAIYDVLVPLASTPNLHCRRKAAVWLARMRMALSLSGRVILGGQLKYYPPVEQAIWVSGVFTLESLPESDEEYGVMRRVQEYYPELWRRACALP